MPLGADRADRRTWRPARCRRAATGLEATDDFDGDEGRLVAGHARLLGRGRRRDRAGARSSATSSSRTAARSSTPPIVEGQIRGGVAQGIGGVLYEHAAYDEDGQFLAGTFMDYLLPTATEIPPIEIHHLETPPISDVDFRGVGEGGASPRPPRSPTPSRTRWRHSA